MKLKLVVMIIPLFVASQIGWTHHVANKEPPLFNNQVFVKQLAKNNEYQPLLEGGKNSVKMEAGRVTKLRGQTGSLHSTKNYEELLIVLKGKGTVNIGDKKYLIKAGEVIYIPPNHEHQVENNKSRRFEYIYVASPAIDK
ncbi:cupin domain-containing protein [bacterium]|nr:cupin domain-containing protein [bacterium]